jgi:hypothetical protein
MFTPGSRACGYKTASGRAEWPNRDPIGEEGGRNLYRIVNNDCINRYDALGLQGGSYIDPEDPPSWLTPDEEEPPHPEDCSCQGPKALAKQHTEKMLAALEDAAEPNSTTRNGLRALNKAVSVINASKAICSAKDPAGCEDFARTGSLTDCFLCCHSISALFGDEVAGLGYLSYCRLACQNAQ